MRKWMGAIHQEVLHINRTTHSVKCFFLSFGGAFKLRMVGLQQSRLKVSPCGPTPRKQTTTNHFIVATLTLKIRRIWSELQMLTLSFLFFQSFDYQGPSDRETNAPLRPPLPRVNDWDCRHGRVWSVNSGERVRLGWMNVCWYFLMRSLQGSKDGWRSIITYWSPRQIFFSQHSSFFG